MAAPTIKAASTIAKIVLSSTTRSFLKLDDRDVLPLCTQVSKDSARSPSNSSSAIIRSFCWLFDQRCESLPKFPKLISIDHVFLAETMVQYRLINLIFGFATHIQYSMVLCVYLHGDNYGKTNSTERVWHEAGGY